jgi:hypothetical protein
VVHACFAAQGAVQVAERATPFVQAQAQTHLSTVVAEVVVVVVAAVEPGWQGRRAGELYRRVLSPTVHNRSCGGPIRATGMLMTALRRCWGC